MARTGPGPGGFDDDDEEDEEGTCEGGEEGRKHIDRTFNSGILSKCRVNQFIPPPPLEGKEREKGTNLASNSFAWAFLSVESGMILRLLAYSRLTANPLRSSTIAP